MKFFNTADLCDEFDNIQIAKPIFSQYGRKKNFCGKIRTVSVLDDNSYIKKSLSPDKLYPELEFATTLTVTTLLTLLLS